jgi:hypothetical protein
MPNGEPVANLSIAELNKEKE